VPRSVAADTSATTYADVATASAVATDRVGVGAWTALTDPQKTATLTTASRAIDAACATTFEGEIASDTQKLEWPRTGTEYGTDRWPQYLVDATIELAFTYADDITAGTDPVSPDLTDANIKRDKTGPLETEYFAPQPVVVKNDNTADVLAAFPLVVQQLLLPLLNVPVTGVTWGTGNAARNS
jgi:hypothetical protein